MADQDPYSAPESELYEAGESTEYGSLEKAVAGDYEFSIGNTYSEAWAAISGHKLQLNGAIAVYFLILFAYVGISTAIQVSFGMPAEGEMPSTGAQLATLPLDLLFYGVNGALTAGFFVMGAKISMGSPTGIGDMFRFMPKLVRALLTYLLMMVMLLVGFLLLVLPGIYLAIAYVAAVPLAVEKDLGPWQALETSRKAISKRWFSVAGFFFVSGLISLLAFLTLGIAGIWLFPMLIVASGILYRNIFGLSEESLSL